MPDETEANPSLSRKMCPILTGFNSIGKACITPVECVKNDCACLDYVTEQCAFLEIAFVLRDIAIAIRSAT